MQFRQNFLFVYPNLLGSVSFCLGFIIISEEFHQAKASSFSKQSRPSQDSCQGNGNAHCETPRKGRLYNVAAIKLNLGAWQKISFMPNYKMYPTLDWVIDDCLLNVT